MAKKSAKAKAVEAALEAAATETPSPIEFEETNFTEEVIIPDFEEVEVEEVETLQEVHLAQSENADTSTEFTITTTDYSDRSLEDVLPNDTLFVQIKPDLFVRGVVVALPGESECFGLKIKALRNNVYAVHPSRLCTSAEDDNVKRRLRLSPRALKAWLAPAE